MSSNLRMSPGDSVQTDRKVWSPSLESLTFLRGCSPGRGCVQMHMPAYCTPLHTSLKGPEPYGRAEGHTRAWLGMARDMRQGQGQHCSVKCGRNIQAHTMGMDTWVQRGGEHLEAQVVTSQKEAFMGTVIMWGCQTWHPLR